jgi:hypothetical protein
VVPAPNGRANGGVALRSRRVDRWSVPLTLCFLGMATLGWTAVRPVSWFNLSDGFFLVAAGIVLFRLLEGRRAGLAPGPVRRSPPLTLQLSVVLLVAGALSSMSSWVPGESLAQLVRLGYLTIFWFWTLRAVCPGFDALMVLIKGWKLMVVLTALSGFYGQLAGGSYISPGNRQVGFAEHPNALGGAIAVGLPIVLFIPTTRLNALRTTRREKTVLAITAVMGFTTLLQSGSVSSAIAAACGLVAAGVCYLVAARSPRRRAAQGRGTGQVRLAPLVVAFVAVLGIGFVFSTNSPVAARVTEIDQEGSRANRGSLDVRQQLNRYAINNIDERLLMGVGLDDDSSRRDLPETVDRRLAIHNLYLRTIHESGLLGMLALLGLNLFAAYQALILAVRLRDRTLANTAIALVGALVAANVTAQFQPIGFVRFYWLPIGIITCLWSLARYYGLGGPGRAETATDRVGPQQADQPA